MNKFIVIWILLITSVLISGPISILDNFQLNQLAVQTSKKIFTGKLSGDGQNQIDSLDCHKNWLEAVSLYYKPNEEVSREFFIKAIYCSEFHLHLVKKFLPRDKLLAELAIKEYPNITIGLYWLIDCIDKQEEETILSLYHQIVSMNPEDGYAWRPIGRDYEQKKMFDEALRAYILSCNNNDPFGSACHSAAVLFENKGDMVNALKFYKLSRWEKSIPEIERLEKSISN